MWTYSDEEYGGDPGRTLGRVSQDARNGAAGGGCDQTPGELWGGHWGEEGEGFQRAQMKGLLVIPIHFPPPHVAVAKCAMKLNSHCVAPL